METEGAERTEETETVWQTDGRVRKGTLQCQQGDHEVEMLVCACCDIIQAGMLLYCTVRKEEGEVELCRCVCGTLQKCRTHRSAAVIEWSGHASGSLKE